MKQQFYLLIIKVTLLHQRCVFVLCSDFERYRLPARVAKASAGFAFGVRLHNLCTNTDWCAGKQVTTGETWQRSSEAE